MRCGDTNAYSYSNKYDEIVDNLMPSNANDNFYLININIIK